MEHDEKRQGGEAVPQESQRRLSYAERCDNLIAALSKMVIVLRSPVLGDLLAEDEYEAIFGRVDAVWAAWVRLGPASERDAAGVMRHARFVFLAAVDFVAKLLELERVCRATARERLGRELTDEDQGLLASPCVKDARRVVSGEALEVVHEYGVFDFVSDVSVDQWADGGSAVDVLELVKWYLAANGYPGYAEKVIREQAERAVEAWQIKPGAPKGDVPRRAKEETLAQILDELGLGGANNVRKEWEAFRRSRGVGTAPR